MTHVFTLKDEEYDEQINIDELYEKKKQRDLSVLGVFNKLLARIHNRIKTTARQKIDEQYCWFLVPEMMIGVPRYDQGACIAYIMDKLKANGFLIKYIHPNLLFISWKHWVPDYVRSEIKKKVGVQIDGQGQIKETMHKNSDKVMLQDPKPKTGWIFKSTKDYKPTGLIYNEEILKKIEG